MESLTTKALQEGHLRLDSSGKIEKMIYVAVNHAERWSDSEEKVRAEFYAELIYKYGYAPQRIGVEVTVPDRSPNDYADLLVFHDDDRKRPYAALECKKDGISDAEFNQAVEQAWGNGKRYRLSPGMQVNAEINLGTRTVLQYLLSPVQKTLHEAGRER